MKIKQTKNKKKIKDIFYLINKIAELTKEK